MAAKEKKSMQHLQLTLIPIQWCTQYVLAEADGLSEPT